MHESVCGDGGVGTTSNHTQGFHVCGLCVWGEDMQVHMYMDMDFIGGAMVLVA